MECPICGSNDVVEETIYDDEETLEGANYKFICNDCSYEWE
ncbi:MAG: hypothetical protein V1725_00340 [archaeon]